MAQEEKGGRRSVEKAHDVSRETLGVKRQKRRARKGDEGENANLAFSSEESRK